MPARLSLVTEHAARILLEGIIDYAGLFPPAAVPMSAAVRNFAHYRASGSGWMLGRFVCPANGVCSNNFQHAPNRCCHVTPARFHGD